MSTDRTERAERTGRTGWADRADRIDRTETTERSGWADGAGRADRTDSAGKTGRADRNDQAERGGPAGRNGRADPVPNAIDAPGTSEAEWRAWPGLGALPELAYGGWRSAVVIAAHPDDEVLGLGGLLSLLAASGVRLRLVAVTDGEASHPGIADVAALVARRVGETGSALAALGAGGVEIVRLGMPDTGLAGREGELAGALGRAASGFEVCLAPWEADVHSDHEATGRAAASAGLHPYFYPIWAWHWAEPGDARLPWERALRIPLPPEVLDRKRAAIGCFTSQLEPRGADLEAVLPPGIVAHFTRDHEVLFR
ncbi:PIG-L family deacetylase [Streptosporangium sp. NPDC002721]|uniref:PIG-L deacetylase family protein n=1 Tax=Streptosporangium sp. NPDC002721 TaxID=3366188 RepID=UPI0036787347